MGEQITEASLQEALIARLGATHAEVADISGTRPSSFSPPIPTLTTPPWNSLLPPTHAFSPL